MHYEQYWPWIYLVWDQHKELQTHTALIGASALWKCANVDKEIKEKC